MARERNPNIDKAEKLYKQGNKLIDISNILNVAEGTIRSWKNRYNWDDDTKKNNATLQRKEQRNATKATKNKKVAKEPKDNISIEVKEVMKNEELTEKQKLFCIYYTKCFNATKAYMKAYECGYNTGAVNGNNLLNNTKIKAQIESLTVLKFNKAALAESLIQKYIDIAFSDITEYLTFSSSGVLLKDSSKVDGSLITEVSEGKDGVKIKLADKMKAMDFLNKHCNLLNDEEKTRLELENKRLQNEKLQAETNKITGADVEIEDTEDIEGEIYGDN